MKIKLLRKDVKIPEFATEGSAGVDLISPLSYILKPKETIKIPMGISIFIEDKGIVGVIVPRSGLGSKHGIIIANTIGVIDSDYQGEIFVPIYNRSDKTYKINRGDRICQILFTPVVQPTFKVVSDFDEITERGEGGLGHTDK